MMCISGSGLSGPPGFVAVIGPGCVMVANVPTGHYEKAASAVTTARRQHAGHIIGIVLINYSRVARWHLHASADFPARWSGPG